MTLTGAPVPVELGGAFPASPPVVARATPPTEATLRRAGALVALVAASILVHFLLFPAADELLKLGVYAIVLLGCAGVLLSPAHRAIADRARRAADATMEIFRAAAELLWAPARVIEAALSPSGELAASRTEAAVRWTGALVSLAAASALLLLVPDHAAVVASDINGGVLAIYAVFLLGCAALLLSPAADLARRAAEAALKFSGDTVLRWAEFTCIYVMLYAICAVEDAQAEAAAVMSSEQYALLFLFLLFLVGVWTVSLSTVTGRALPTLPVRLPLSPAHPAATDLARRAAEAARNMSPATFLRWAGFTCTCVMFYAIRAVGDAPAEAAAATVVMSSEQYALLLMFLLFLVGVWTVSLSTVTGRVLPTMPVRLPLPPLPPVAAAEDDHGGGVVNCTAPAEDCDTDGVASKV